MKILRPYQQKVVDKLRIRLKETEHPLLVNASVGAGKSLIIASLLQIIERAGWRALCLTMNSTLIRQNAQTYIEQGGHAGIYCSTLGKKETTQPVIFASPMSVRNSIKKEGKLSKVPFNLIVIDECHNVNVMDKKTSYMRIFHHYKIYAQALRHKLRFVGLTGTPFRGKREPIVGDDLFFKEEVCAITADWLIENFYLTPPLWGHCDKSLQYDFRKLKVNSLGKFNSHSLEKAINKKPRLTGKIMAEVVEIVKDRKGAFIFASTVKHCYECAEWLPADQTAVITGETTDKMREEYISKAHAGIIKYLINVNVLSTGVDIPVFDTVVFVRPTESLVLYIQCLGRGLRLFEGKTDCLILDYAGNLERHSDIDNPIINNAIQPKDLNDPEYCIKCFDCCTMNTISTRRCIGIQDKQRCEHFFEWKNCPFCETQNDIVSRKCRACDKELIDPNRKLNNIASGQKKISLKVKETKYELSNIMGSPCFKINYFIDPENNPTNLNVANESFLLSSQKAVNFFYYKIVKLHFVNPYGAYKHLQNVKFYKKVIENNELYSPKTIDCIDMNGHYLKVVGKHFDNKIIEENLVQSAASN